VSVNKETSGITEKCLAGIAAHHKTTGHFWIGLKFADCSILLIYLQNVTNYAANLLI